MASSTGPNIVAYSSSSEDDIICIKETKEVEILKIEAAPAIIDLESSQDSEIIEVTSDNKSGKPLPKKFFRRPSSQSGSSSSGFSSKNRKTHSRFEKRGAEVISPKKSNSISDDLFSSTDSDSSSEDITALVLKRPQPKVAVKNLEENLTESSDSSDISSDNNPNTDSDEEDQQHQTRRGKKSKKKSKFQPKINIVQTKTKFIAKQDPFDLCKLSEMLSLNDPEVIQEIKANPLSEVGIINAIFDGFITIKGIKKGAILDVKTCLFFEDLTLLGLVFDVFGKYDEASYIVRLRTADLDNIKSKITLHETKVYFAPHGNKSLKSYVQVHNLLNDKSHTDASWIDDQECPQEYLDYSDDEKETKARKELRESKRKRKIEENNEKIKEKTILATSQQEKLIEKQNEFLEKMAEQQLKMIEEMDQSNKEQEEFRRFFYSDQNFYVRRNGNSFNRKTGKVDKLFQSQVKNHFAPREELRQELNEDMEQQQSSSIQTVQQSRLELSMETGEDYVEEMKRMNPGFEFAPSVIEKTHEEIGNSDVEINDGYNNDSQSLEEYPENSPDEDLKEEN